MDVGAETGSSEYWFLAFLSRKGTILMSLYQWQERLIWHHLAARGSGECSPWLGNYILVTALRSGRGRWITGFGGQLGLSSTEPKKEQANYKSTFRKYFLSS